MTRRKTTSTRRAYSVVCRLSVNHERKVFLNLMCFQPRKPEARSCCRHVASSWSNLLMVDSNLLIGFPPSSVASCQVSLQAQCGA